MYTIKSLDEKAIAAFAPAEKIGLVATVNPEGLPHITLITSIRAAGPKQITLGEFCRGNSKAHLKDNPKAAFLVMTMDRKVWRGHARWTHSRTEGPEYQAYNDLPMFRYNAYFGINTVHYLDLVDARGAEALPLPKIIGATLLTRYARSVAAEKHPGRILSPYSEALFNRLDALKFIAYIQPDGYPEIVPVFSCQAVDSRRLLFSPLAYASELNRIAAGQKVAVFGLTLQMEDVLVRGTFTGYRRLRMIRTGSVEIDWVYNSMPPAHGQIYPPVPLRPVTQWADFG